MIAVYKYKTTIETVTPFNQAFVKDAQRFHGTWLKESKRWVFKREDIEKVIDSICHCYGVNRDGVNIVDYSGTDKKLDSNPAFEVEVSRPVEGDPDWKKLNNKDLVDLYLAIEQELRRREI